MAESPKFACLIGNRGDWAKRWGVIVYVRESCSASLWSFSADDRTFELLWARVGATFIGAIYHPPRPAYTPESLLNYLELCVEEITRRYPTATIIVAGDFNQLPEDAVVERTGLTQIVRQTTR